jgi:hypothetical protein
MPYFHLYPNFPHQPNFRPHPQPMQSHGYYPVNSILNYANHSLLRSSAAGGNLAFKIGYCTPHFFNAFCSYSKGK